MNRRNYLLGFLGVGLLSSRASRAAHHKPIQLHVDLEVDPAREGEMVENFHKIFRPAISGQPGFVEVRLMKLRQALAGPAPGNFKYRLLISFKTEEQRQTWVATDEHQRVWPTIEKTLTGTKYGVLLYDVV